MKRVPIYTIVSSCIIFAVYSVIVFVFKEEKTTAFWIAYACTLFAMVLAEGIVAYMTAGGKKTITFLQIPIHIYCGGFIAMELVVGLILALFVSAVKAVVLIEIILYAAFLLLQLTVFQGKEMMESIEDELKESTRFISELRLEAENLYAFTKGTANERLIKEVLDAIRYSDPVSSLKLQQVENEITCAFELLREAVHGNSEKVEEYSQKVLYILGERNRRCKAWK